MQRSIKNLIPQKDEKVYILLKDEAIRHRFMSDADTAGITYENGTKASGREADDIMALFPNGTICFVGFAGRMNFQASKVLRIDYEKYMNGKKDYIIK